MTYEILYRPTAAVASIRLEPGEAVRAETGTMLAMTGEIDVEARTGGLGKIVGRLLAGESAFQNPLRRGSGRRRASSSRPPPPATSRRCALRATPTSWPAAVSSPPPKRST